MVEDKPSLTAYAFPAYRSRFCFSRSRFLPGHKLGQTALLPGGGILMNDALLAGTIQQLDGVSVSGLGLVAGGGAHPLEGGAELAPMSTILSGSGASLSHALGGRPDSGHGNLREKWILPETGPVSRSAKT
jgi:hypothetical protein